MKKKLGIQDFADYIVQREDISHTEAETFVRAFFDVVEQGLEEDKLVKIKGLGTFKLIAVSERESININTGERFQISGHTKVSFTPDASIKELVNRPFAHFETVDLNDETDTKEFEAIDDKMQIEAEELNEEEDANEDNEPEEEANNENEELQLSDKVNVAEAFSQDLHNGSSADAKDMPKNEANEQNEPHTTDSASFSENGHEANTNEVKPVNIVTAEDDSNTLETNDTDAKKNKEKAESLVVTTPQSLQKPQTTQTETIEEHKEQQSYTSQHNTTAQTTQGYVYGEVPSPRKRNWWKMVSIFCGLFMLMALSYFAGYYRMLCPGCNDFNLLNGWEKTEHNVSQQHSETPISKPINQPLKADTTSSSAATKQSKTTDKDSLTIENKAATNERKNQNDSTKNEKKKYIIPPTHTVKAGDNVYRISRKYYGSDAYAERIIKENNLKDANTIVVGMQLKMPKP